MSPRRPRVRLFWARWRSALGAWFLLFFTQAACATRAPWGSLTEGYRDSSLTPPPAPKARVPSLAEPGLEKATVYVAAFLEPGAVTTRPVPILEADFQRAFHRLAQDVRLGQRTPREAALELQEEVKALLPGRLRFKQQGVDVVDLTTGRQYEILSGTESNLARHGRRMAGEFFRMLTF